VPRKRPVSEYPEGAKRKAEIIRVATKSFALNGYRDASLASIANAAGLTQPGLLHHFPSKPELLLAVLRDRELRDKTLVADAIKANPGDVVGLLKVLVAHNAAAQDDTLLYTVISAEATSPSHPAHEFFAARYTRVRKALTRSISKQAEPGMSEDQITALATICMAVMDGLQIQSQLDPKIDMAANFEVFGEIMQRAIASSSEPGVTDADEKAADR